MSFLLCSQRRQKSYLDREEEGVPCVKFSDVDPDTLPEVCSNRVFSFSGRKLWQNGARSKLRSLSHILIPKVQQWGFLE